jgi:hypothetical protein
MILSASRPPGPVAGFSRQALKYAAVEGEGRDYQVKKNGPASCAAHEV